MEKVDDSAIQPAQQEVLSTNIFGHWRTRSAHNDLEIVINIFDCLDSIRTD